jgi:signal transduction histidine kinase
VGIAALYLVCVLALGDVVGTTTGAPLIATVLAAILIQPAHARIRRWANQVVYGDRDDPAAALRRLGERLDAGASPDETLLAATQSVARALRCVYVAIEADGILASTGSKPCAHEQRFPLAYAGDAVGALVIGTSPGAPIGPQERRLIDDLGPHLGVVLHANRLTRDLQLSRQRLLAARDDERRRLQRDLHDGLGPTLAALALQADRGRGLLARDPAAAASLFDALGQHIRETVGTVRGIVAGLRPPDLDHLGLAGALESLAGRLTTSTLNLCVSADCRSANLPAAVELAVYRIASEAMTNVSRHARASRCEVRLHVGDQELQLSVTDDGQGLDGGVGTGTGMHSMRERAEELAGTFSITSVQPHGACVFVRIPLLERAL